MTKLSAQGTIASLAPKEKVFTYLLKIILASSQKILLKRRAWTNESKKTLTGLVQQKLIVKHGAGAGTNYSL